MFPSLALTGVLLAASPAALVVSVGGPPEDPAFLPVYAAAALGTFEAEGIEPILRRAKHPTAALEPLRDRDAAVAVTTLDQAVRGAWARGMPVRILVAHTRAPAAALLVSASGRERVARVEDLRGKKVGIPGPGTTGHLLLGALLRAARIEPWQLDVVSLGGPTLVSRLTSGAVAAAFVDEPWLSRAVSAGGATVLMDFRRPEVVAQALGGPFFEVVSVMRAEAAPGTPEKDRKAQKAGKPATGTPPEGPPEAALAGFARALIRIQAWLAATAPAEIADRLPDTLVGDRERFVARLTALQATYAADGEATGAGLEATLRVLRGGSPWPVTLTLGPSNLREPPFVSAARSSLGPHPAPP